MIDLPTAALRTELVVLETLDVDDISDLLADPPRRHEDWHSSFPRQDDRDGVGMVREVSGWTSRGIRERAGGLVVGTIGFFGPPERSGDGVPEAEVGYGLVEEARRRGLMSAALPALLALTDAAGVRVRAHTEPDNAASLALLRRVGFADHGPDPDDEDQPLLVRPVS
ncbi:GNAT family N-acetyltransferase [Nocardioides mangrovicus]|uniref:GNAT family N-acetyltransferase n=1 Tax=Nocardioides mangrovicus TaxID=2478913 RepID=UPI0013140A33|nr:GNAT family N-acetyltransferase [Nocardioides mangrovicus]